MSTNSVVTDFDRMMQDLRTRTTDRRELLELLVEWEQVFDIVVLTEEEREELQGLRQEK